MATMEAPVAAGIDVLLDALGVAEVGRSYDDVQRDLLAIRIDRASGGGPEVTFRHRHNGAAVSAGSFTTPALGQLREKLMHAMRSAPGDNAAGQAGAAPSVWRIVVGDAAQLHRAARAGDVFQVASQLNCLEFASPEQLPEHGIGCYVHDRTQGPACALACAAGTAVRNYLREWPDGALGQRASRQIDTLADLHEAVLDVLGVADVQLWAVRNGYLAAKPDLLVEARRAFDQAFEPLRDRVRVGVQHNTTVTSLPAQPHPPRVHQVFCSGISIPDSGCSAATCEPLARLLLGAAYEATFLVALAEAEARRPRSIASPPALFLTCVGGGVFENPMQWIVDAMETGWRRAAALYQASPPPPLDVAIVQFPGSPVTPELEDLVRRMNSNAGRPAERGATSLPTAVAPADKPPPPSLGNNVPRRPNVTAAWSWQRASTEPLPVGAQDSPAALASPKSIPLPTRPGEPTAARRGRTPSPPGFRHPAAHPWPAIMRFPVGGQPRASSVRAGGGHGGAAPPRHAPHAEPPHGMAQHERGNSGPSPQAVPPRSTAPQGRSPHAGPSHGTASHAMAVHGAGQYGPSAFDPTRPVGFFRGSPMGELGSVQRADPTTAVRAPNQICVMSCNVLAERHYQRFAKCPVLPWAQRLELTVQFLATAMQKEQCDVILLQEFCLDDLWQPLRQEMRGAPLWRLAYSDPAARGDGCVILVNDGHVVVHGEPSQCVLQASGGRPKTALKLLVSRRGGDPNNKLALIDAHVPYVSDDAARGLALQPILQELQKFPGGRYVLGGDFNTDDTGLRAHLAAGGSDFLDACEALPHSSRTPRDTLDKIDHLYYTPRSGVALAEPATFYPSDPTWLLPHAAGSQPLGRWFSDHGAVFATFALHAPPAGG
jgi:hypothetical protein